MAKSHDTGRRLSRPAKAPPGRAHADEYRRPSGKQRPSRPKGKPAQGEVQKRDSATADKRGATVPGRPAASSRRAPPKRRPESDGRPAAQMRIAKALARAGLCSRRDGERWIEAGRVAVNGRRITSPALDVTPRDTVTVDGQPLPQPEPTRLWRYSKPKGQVTTHRDPEGRPTVFENLPDEMPRVVSIGRLDYNTEGLLLMTTDGELARYLELPATGWLRRYRVRAHGDISQETLDELADGISVDGVHYGPIEATLDSRQGRNVWLTIGLREGKNREVRKVLATLGLDVNRLIRISFGPFQLLDLKPGTVASVRRATLRDQLGARLAARFGLGEDGEEDDPGESGRTNPPSVSPRQSPKRGASRSPRKALQGAAPSDRQAKPRPASEKAREKPDKSRPSARRDDVIPDVDENDIDEITPWAAADAQRPPRDKRKPSGKAGLQSRRRKPALAKDAAPRRPKDGQ